VDYRGHYGCGLVRGWPSSVGVWGCKPQKKWDSGSDAILAYFHATVYYIDYKLVPIIEKEKQLSLTGWLKKVSCCTVIDISMARQQSLR